MDAWDSGTLTAVPNAVAASDAALPADRQTEARASCVALGPTRSAPAGAVSSAAGEGAYTAGGGACAAGEGARTASEGARTASGAKAPIPRCAGPATLVRAFRARSAGHELDASSTSRRSATSRSASGRRSVGAAVGIAAVVDGTIAVVVEAVLAPLFGKALPAHPLLARLALTARGWSDRSFFRAFDPVDVGPDHQLAGDHEPTEERGAMSRTKETM